MFHEIFLSDNFLNEQNYFLSFCRTSNDVVRENLNV